MRINRYVFHTLNFLFIIGASLLVAGAIYFALTYVDTSKGTDAAVQANVERLKASAQVYYSRLHFYDGVCDDIGVPNKFSCTESTTAYALSARLSTGAHYCVDSSGFAGTVPWQVTTEPTCRGE